MKKQILFFVSLLLILGVCSLRNVNKSLAQSEVNTQTSVFPQQNQTSEVPENVAYRQLFQMIDSFEREAQKQENQGFASRAETLRSIFQKILQLNDLQFGKLKEASSNFSDEVSRLKLKAKKLNDSKSSQAKKISEMKKIEKDYNQMPLTYRENLRKVFSDIDFESFAKIFQEKVAAKMSYRFDTESKSLFLGYSIIDYDGEVTGYSVTVNDGSSCDWEEGNACVGTEVTGTLSNNEEGDLDADSAQTCNVNAEVFLYSSTVLPGVRYCMDGDHLYDDSSYCSFQGGGISSTSENCLVTPPAPNVTSVTFQTIAPNNVPIDANPNIGGGLRIFPDDNAPMENANRQVIQINAGISEPIAGRTIYFRNFDVDDPSTDTTIDPNGNMGGDNNGNVIGSKSGLLFIPSGSSGCSTFSGGVACPTNSNGIATVNFTVTMQPGDNFAIAASTDPNQISAVSVSGTGLLNGQGQGVPTSCDYTDSVCRSEMLTVWRRLHIEVDSMGAAQGNFVVGNFAESKGIGILGTEVLVSNQNLETNRFENGRLVSGSRIFRIISNTENSVTIRVLSGRGANVSEGETFTLYDDDDFNDSGTLDGDTGENIPEPPDSLLQPTDILCSETVTTNCNVFASSYIRPMRYTAAADISDNSFFQANVTEDTGVAIRSMFIDFDRRATEADPKFWTAYLLGGYQYTIDRDEDPETEPRVPLGITDAQNGVGSIVFMETNGPKECPEPTISCNIAKSSAHEIGHLLNAGDGEGGIMSNQSLSFLPVSIAKIRNTTHP